MALRNAFEDIATEGTLTDLSSKLDRVSSSGDAHLVSGNKVRYRREFNDPTLADWDVVVGPGMTVTASGGNLTVATGTTANSMTTLTTKQAFSVPFRTSFGFQISQKITNQEFYVEIVAENEDGSIDESVVAAWRVAGADSTTTTNARTEVRNGGATRIQSANIASQAAQTSASVYEIVLESDEVWFYSKLADSNAGRYAPTVRNTTSPDPGRRYRMRYRIINGASAPASTTTFTSTFAAAVDYTEFQTEVIGGSGSSAAGQALAVVSAGTFPVSGAVSLTATSSVTGMSATKMNSLATTNALSIRTAAAKLYSYTFMNTAAATRYVKFYNKASAPTVGTDTPLFTLAIPAGMQVNQTFIFPVTFSTGLATAITAGAADNDATATAVNDVIGWITSI